MRYNDLSSSSQEITSLGDLPGNLRVGLHLDFLGAEILYWTPQKTGENSWDLNGKSWVYWGLIGFKLDKFEGIEWDVLGLMGCFMGHIMGFFHGFKMVRHFGSNPAPVPVWAGSSPSALAGWTSARGCCAFDLEQRLLRLVLYGSRAGPYHRCSIPRPFSNLNFLIPHLI